VFVQEPNLKGALAEAKIAAQAIELGIPVLRPVAEHGRYDLALEIGGHLLRVQCKWGRLIRGGSVISVNLQGSRHTPSGYVRTVYSAAELDFVAVYCGDLDRCYLVPIELVAGRGGIHLRLTPARNGQRACLNLAAEFEFAGAVAQWEERLRGTQEVTGSSPVSSTPTQDDPDFEIVGAHEFRNRFGWYMQRAAGGVEIRVERRGRPLVRLLPAQEPLKLAA
jgi:prevent-host-death family protein